MWRRDHCLTRESPHPIIRNTDFRVGRLLVSAIYLLAWTTSPLERLGTLGVYPRLPDPIVGPLLMRSEHTISANYGSMAIRTYHQDNQCQASASNTCGSQFHV